MKRNNGNAHLFRNISREIRESIGDDAPRRHAILAAGGDDLLQERFRRGRERMKDLYYAEAWSLVVVGEAVGNRLETEAGVAAEARDDVGEAQKVVSRVDGCDERDFEVGDAKELG